MRPGLRESIEPSGADGGNVGARPGVEICSDGLEFAEFTRIRRLETLCAPKRTDSMYSGHVSGWDRPLRLARGLGEVCHFAQSPKVL